MSVRFDTIFVGGECVTPSGVVRANIGVADGKITAIGDVGTIVADKVVNCAGLTILPGVIDSQVHFREPGLEHKEDLETGTRAAALGGVTSLFEMPNTKPSTTTAEAIEDKLARAKGRAHIDHAFYVGAAAENAEKLGELELLPGCAGVKIFMGSSTGSLLVDDPEVLEAVLRSGQRRVAVHCEDEARLRERKVITTASDVRPELHAVWRDEESARLATEKLLAAARRAERRVHVLHVTTASEMAMLAGHKDIATVEVTPQHLTLAAPECYDELGTKAQMNPPIRDAQHRRALWAGIRSGVVDVIGSDHAPHTLEEKAKPYPQSPSGLPGVQTTLPLMLDHVNAGKLSLLRLVDLLCHGPARIFGMIGKGRLAVGNDADLSIVDMKASFTIDDADQASRCGYTPFHGREVVGKPVMTWVRGQAVMRDGSIETEGAGAPVRFESTLRQG